METTIFFPFFFTSSTARQTWSEASPLPPGESTRSTTAFTSRRFSRSRSCLTTVSEPMVLAERKPPPLLPVTMSPSSQRTATFFPSAQA